MRLTLAVLVLGATMARAQLIPAIRLADWTPGASVGVIGGIPSRTSIINVTQAPYNADNTGVSDASAAINSAIAAAGTNQVIFLPAGNYRCNNAISITRNDVVLRGAGMDITILKFQATATSPNVSTGSPGGSYPYFYAVDTSGNAVTAGHTKGSNTVTISGATTDYPIGGIIQFARFNSTSQTEDPLLVSVGGNAGGAGFLMRHRAILTSKTSSTLTFFPPLSNSYTGGTGGARVTMANIMTHGNYGIEDLTVDVVLSAPIFAVYFDTANNAWAKNVKIQTPKNYAFSIADSVNIEIRHCYVTASSLGPGSNSAGILMGGGSNCLIEDNIIIDCTPGLEVNNSDTNVFAYNFWDSPLTNSLSIDSNHGPHCMHNLYEGNIARHMQSDGYFGSDGYGMVFRNWFTGYGTGLTAPPDITFTFALKRFSHQYSLVGNVFGSFAATYTYGFDTLSFGKPNIGNGDDNGLIAPPWADFGVQPGPGPGGWQELDGAVESTMVRKGNWNYFTDTQESTGGDTIPNSLFRSVKPAYFGSLTWPPVDPAAPGTATITQIHQKIPAGYRYVNGVDPSGVPDVTPPVLTGKTIPVAGNQLILTFSENVQMGTGGSGGWVLSMSGGPTTLSFSSVSGLTVTYAITNRVVNAGETGTVAYTQPGNGVEDQPPSANDLVNLSGSAVTNSSTVGGIPPGGVIGGKKIGPPRSMRVLRP